MNDLIAPLTQAATAGERAVAVDAAVEAVVG